MSFFRTNSIWAKDEGNGPLIGFASRVVTRICRSTIQADSYTLQAGLEERDRVRAAFADFFGTLSRISDLPSSMNTSHENAVA